MNSPKNYQIIPPDEHKCIWMAAAVLSYKLCEREFDCDSCPLDAAMRRRFSEPATVREGDATLAGPAGMPEIPEGGFMYSRNHWWMRRTGQNQVRLGIETGLARALLGVRDIVFPSLHQRLLKGRTCIWAVMEGGTLPLEAPMEGVVRAVNHDLVGKSHLLCQRPFDEGWLCELEAGEAEAASAGLMPAGEARPKYEADRNRFMTSLAGALRGKRPSVGPTLADGGEQLQTFADILGATRYLALVRQAFGSPRR